jgi:hypothetical protein
MEISLRDPRFHRIYPWRHLSEGKANNVTGQGKRLRSRTVEGGPAHIKKHLVQDLRQNRKPVTKQASGGSMVSRRGSGYRSGCKCVARLSGEMAPRTVCRH